MLQTQYLRDIGDLLSRRGERLRNGDATTIGIAFAIMAVSIRVLPEGSAQLLCSAEETDSRSIGQGFGSFGNGRSEPSTTHRRYSGHALLAYQIATTDDKPSLMQVFLKLVLYRYTRVCAHSQVEDIDTGLVDEPRVRDNLVQAGGYLAQAIKLAQALGMNREWQGIPTVERELRRRLFWALYVADRELAL